MRKSFCAFLSHYKMQAAAEARILKLELVRALRCKEENVFLDSDNLSDLRELLDHVRQSDCFVIMYTKEVMSRPWCLLEIDEAVRCGLPIIIVRIENMFADSLEGMTNALRDLPAYLKSTNKWPVQP